MAYASVASLLQTVDLLLTHHHSSISPQFEIQIGSIHENTRFLRSFIEGSSDRVNNWEETIRQASNKAEDIIELLVSDSLLESSSGSSRSELERGDYEVRYSFDELEKVREEIESIVSRVKGGRRGGAAVGSDDELTEMVSRLCGGSSSREVIAICGGGGMGKTTLARKACHHPSIVEHFDVRAWSTVTGEYVPARVVRELLRHMNAEKSRSEESLLEFLGRRRYLIVLDDVWSVDVLEMLNILLPDYGNGSRIIFATRSSELASSAHHVHEMRLLDDDTAWNLLREKLFEGDPCPFQLESMGKAIARSCGGHPLSVAVVSGILAASDQTEATWEDVSENMKIASEGDGDKLHEIVYLSYTYLPHHLRPCFLYLGIFPVGNQIHVSKLIRLWIAEGFVNESGYGTLEETGEEYVDDLLRRGLVSVHKRKSNGGVRSVRVHDLVRSMCLRQARIDNFNLRFDRDAVVPESIRLCRRVSSLNCRGDFLRGVYGSTIRTLFFCSEYGELNLRCWMGNVRLLRVLNLLSVKSYSLSDEVFELFHLRYLAIYCSFSIPEAISNLENLQTLVIYHEVEGGVFEELPDGIWRMPQLRHLYVLSFKLPNKKGPTLALENLQTLKRAVDFVCSIENLKMFENVKRLDLLYTKKWRDVVEGYELCNLTCLQKLEALKIETNLTFGEEHKMSCVTFPSTLKKLSLRGVQLSWEDMKTVASLPNLEVLKLKNYACVGDTWETSEGGFSRLMTLRIEESNLKNWITKSSHFPRLWKLVLVRCSSLLEVPYEIAGILTLKIIDLDDTNRALLRSAERIQQDRHSLGHDPLYIYVV